MVCHKVTLTLITSWLVWVAISFPLVVYMLADEALADYDICLLRYKEGGRLQKEEAKET